MEKGEEEKLDREQTAESKDAEVRTGSNIYGELAGAVLFFLLGLYLVIKSILMPNEELTGNKELWYSAPGVFPAFVGAVLTILSLLLIIQCFRENKEREKIELAKIKAYIGNQHFKSLLVVLIYLFVYIFILLGRIKFSIATFIFLSVSMITFRKEKIAIWKLILISFLTSAIITYGFGTLAKIPLL